MSRREQGDTIIEVVLAFVIFTMAAVAAITLINSGLATTQRGLEATLVRQQIDAQGELLRYLRDTRDEAWDQIVAPGALVATPISLAGTVSPGNICTNAATISQAFYVQPQVAANPALTTYSRRAINNTTYRTPDTYAKIEYTAGAIQSQGIWIQATRAQERSGASVPAYDFYIHACWHSVGQSVPMMLGTIVRIYE